MRDGWTTARLGTVCHVIGGGTPSKALDAYYSGDIPWATVRDMRSDVIIETECKITKAAVASSATNIVPAGNVVVATRVGLGKVCLLGQDTAINQDLRGIVPIDPSALSVRFLFWWLKSIAELIVAEGTGATVQGVKLPFLRSLQIPLPSLTEQQRTVGILDEASEGIAVAQTNAAKNLQNAYAIVERHLRAVFTTRGDGWIHTTIGEQVRFIDYRGKTPVKTESGLRLITAKNVKMGYLQETPKEFVAPESYDGWMTRGIPKRGDVLFTTEAPLANVAQLDTDEKVVFAQRIIIMQPEASKLDSTFLKYLLLSAPIQQRIHAKGTGATAKGIKASLLRTVDISFPRDVREQEQIVVKLNSLTDEAQHLASVYRRKLEALDELKRSLLAQAFTGRLSDAQPTQVRHHLASFPVTLPNISTTDLHAGILAMAFHQHDTNGRLRLFTHVKAEKIAHMVEAHLGIELGRSPVKDAAGPNDFPHLKKVEHRARMANYFDFRQVGGAYRVNKLTGFGRLTAKTQVALGERRSDVERLLQWMLPMTVRQAELAVTVFAAWNNLLLEGQHPTDEQIVTAARENWHPAKLTIDRQKFFAALHSLRDAGIKPEGRGKPVRDNRN